MIRMISFYRDFLDGTIYTVVALVAVILILAIIGFMMEKIKSYKEEQAKTAYMRLKETEQRGDTIVFDSKVDRIVGTPVEKTEADLQESSPSKIMLTPAPELESQQEEIVNKQDTVVTINSSTLDVPEIVEEQSENPQTESVSKTEDLTKVIDFGSTDDVKIDEL